MKRREFFRKTGHGIAGILATLFGLASFKAKKSSKMNPLKKPFDFQTIRKDFPPLRKWTYLDTAFVGLMSRQVKAAHEAFLQERLQFGPFPSDKTILGIWMDKAEDVRNKLASFLSAEKHEIAFTLCTGCGSNIAINGIDWHRGDNVVIDYINEIGMEAIERHNLTLVRLLREGLRQRGVKFFTPENKKSPILTFFLENEKAFGKKMKEKKVYITARRWGKGHVRISPHFYNNEEDIETFIHAFDTVFKS